MYPLTYVCVCMCTVVLKLKLIEARLFLKPKTTESTYHAAQVVEEDKQAQELRFELHYREAGYGRAGEACDKLLP